jgi:hypothetical protein
MDGYARLSDQDASTQRRTFAAKWMAGRMAVAAVSFRRSW